MVAVDGAAARAAAEARRRLDGEMAPGGLWPERSPWIRDAVARLPRDAFAPERLWDWDGCAWQPVDRGSNPDRWLELLYGTAHRAAVTQVTGGLPTSSLSAQALVVDMLDSLRLEPGQRVLELGTSPSAWNAALLTHRAGPGRVTTVEVDPDLAAAGATRLKTAGLDVDVVTGDGSLGHPAGAPYDRAIATYAVDRVPWAWIEQTRPGGRLVLPWGRLGHAALAVAPDHTHATGWMQGLAQFMPDRTTTPPGTRDFATVRAHTPPSGPEQHTTRDPEHLRTDWGLLSHLRVVLPESVITTAVDHDGASAWIHDGHESWATLSSTPEGVYRAQGGPRHLADLPENA
ncbi:protein-L-isoaspartate O-methyltransferase [Kitasatospora sp. NPDC088783]|uniref:protein-L-isoaspartate O-methyltransferase n=1 Tax=Kitasatospora sp. NPDC088783 TaxID=3364077 RepID=UPI003817E73B